MTKDFIEGFAIGIVSGGIAVWLMVLVWFALERLAERFQTIRLYLKLYQHIISIHAPAWGATLGIIPDFARFV